MDFAQRAARNEEIFRGVNEQIDAGAAQHEIENRLPFHCECGRATCLGTVEVTRAQYERVAAERYRFLLIPGHEHPDVERVVERHESFVVAEKIGEAREQIDRDHPQERHRT
jgi:hypothetical protein